MIEKNWMESNGWDIVTYLRSNPIILTKDSLSGLMTDHKATEVVNILTSQHQERCEKAAKEIETLRKLVNDEHKRYLGELEKKNLLISSLEASIELLENTNEYLQKDRNNLELQLHDLVSKNIKLTNERDEVRREVCEFHHLTGFLSGDYANSRGWDCFKNKDYKFSQSAKDFKLFLEGQDKIWLDRNEQLRAERDEARREVCEAKTDIGFSRPILRNMMEYAIERGWNCFSQKTMDEIAKLDEEMGLND